MQLITCQVRSSSADFPGFVVPSGTSILALFARVDVNSCLFAGFGAGFFCFGGVHFCFLDGYLVNSSFRDGLPAGAFVVALSSIEIIALRSISPPSAALTRGLIWPKPVTPPSGRLACVCSTELPVDSGAEKLVVSSPAANTYTVRLTR